MQSLHQIEQYFQKIGIPQKGTLLYLELARVQHTSVLQLSKKLAISRTQAYRYLDILQQYNLVSSEQVNGATRYHALPLSNIEGMLTERQAELRALQQNLTNMDRAVREFAAESSKQTTTRHYYGVEGLKQANWNLTKTVKEYRVFETAHLPQHFDEAFARRCNARLTERKLVSYDLTNQKHINLADLAPYNIRHLNYCYIDPRILTISFEMYIYNDDIVTLLDYSPENMHAIEIQNPMLYTLMYQIHTTLWKLGQPIRLQ